eukprot:SAG31_NODE_3856_length_3815_cov_3.607374_2_plen_132_part_00
MKSAPIQNEVMNRWFAREASLPGTAGNMAERRGTGRTIKPHLETHCDLGWQAQPIWNKQTSSNVLMSEVDCRLPTATSSQNRAQPEWKAAWERPKTADMSLRPSGNMSNLTIGHGIRSEHDRGLPRSGAPP